MPKVRFTSARRAAAVVAVLTATVLAGCATSASTGPESAITPSATATATPGPTPSEVQTPPAPTTTGPAGPTSPTTAPTSQAPSNFPDADRLAFPEASTDLRTITVATLPAEGRATLVLIKDGGPFPFPQDGVTFQNRERALPRQAAGFYQEFTVPTPGSSDRGARRIVKGADGALFWTSDHYRTFREIIEPWS